MVPYCDKNLRCRDSTNISSTRPRHTCWIGSLIIACIYILHVYLIENFYIVSYGLKIYMLNLLISFLFSQVDSELQELYDDATLPIGDSDEFRPFVRHFLESKFCGEEDPNDNDGVYWRSNDDSDDRGFGKKLMF
ncbi:hypothetical protein AHAS_Ahas15G0371100 [Arachis hypogaea]